MFRLARIAPKIAGLLAAGLFLSACAVTDLGDTPQPMGRFLLGFNEAAVASDFEAPDLSRKIENSVAATTVRKEMNDRFSRYDGDQYFHIATTVLGYMLAPAGIPVVAAPKSVLIADVSVYSDAGGKTPLNAEPKRFTVFEEGGGDVIVGSGLTRTAEEQMASLARSLAKSVHVWMLENKDWFGDASLMDPAATSPGRPMQPLPPSGEVIRSATPAG